jgi:tRNA(Ile)-lysidine synthase
VWPQLVQAFPDAEGALAAAATWAQDAAAVLAEVAAQDLAVVAGPRGLQRSAWLGLSPARRVQALKAWLHTVTGVSAPSSLLVRLQSEWPTARDAQWPAPQGCLHHHRGCLVFTPGDAVTAGRDAAVSAAREASLSITRAGSYGLPGWGGVLRVQRVKEGGTPLAWLAHLTLQERAGGEQFQAGLGRPARSLKKQYQAAEVPAWLRDGPLVYSGGQLVFVPGLGLDTRVLALPGQPQVSLLWERSS